MIKRRIYCYLILLVFAVGFFFSPPLYSQQKRKQTLSFEDELVEGTAQKPELFYLLDKKNFNYKKLIKLRENFHPEMKKTAEELQSRSEN